MEDESAPHSWFEPLPTAIATENAEETTEFIRQWQGFMTARVTLATVMFALQSAMYLTGFSQNGLLLAVSVGYCIATIASKVIDKPHLLSNSFNWSWFTLVGIDVLVFTVMQVMQGSNINYTPLYALPILLSAVLGQMRLALGSAAGVTMVLLGNTLWISLAHGVEATASYIQAALSGLGYFVIALLANQLSSRLASAGQRARRNQAAANIQRQVNELVIESLPDGVLIVDGNGQVLAANPAARQILGQTHAINEVLFDLKSRPAWAPLWHLARICIGVGESTEEDVNLEYSSNNMQRIRVRTRLAAPKRAGGENLCVLFMQDLRSLEAQLRTEKLLSMGRMSAAVAHEIRNPLAAIVQANALLEEDISDSKQQKLIGMIGQNARRLGKIVDDILQTAHISSGERLESAFAIPLQESTQRICQEWAQQNGEDYRLLITLDGDETHVRFDYEHLRRVLINLLDNASRYAQKSMDAIQVTSCTLPNYVAALSVWSDAPPIEQSVERHLFEPFFSSESRSSGLGLYICRELCRRHGATLSYCRAEKAARASTIQGNEFVLTLMPAHDAMTSSAELHAN